MNVVIIRNGALDREDCTVLARRQVPLLQRLKAQGVRPTVVLFGDPGGLRHQFEAGGIDVRHLYPALPPSGQSVRHMPFAVMRLRTLLRTLDYDILEGSDVMPAIAAGLAAFSRPRNAPVVYRRHHHRGRPRVYRASRLAARLADRTIVSCEAMRQHASEVDRVRPERIEIAATGTPEPPAHSCEDLAEARRELGIPPDARIVGVISQLRKQKGIDILIHSLDHLRDRHNLHVIIAGNGPEASHLRELGGRGTVPVHFIGHRDDVDLWLSLSDIVVMPSRDEAFGRVTLETMASARPLVATRVGGLPEAVVDGETAVLVPPENAPALASAIATLLDDRALAERMGAAARRRYESHFTMEHMATAWREAWQRIIASSGGKARA
jgi:glycosyltransferase involved in cell wall biosynthesis